MNYKKMYHEFSHRRREELSLCHQATRTAVDLYVKILETNRMYFDQEFTPDRSGSNELCVALENLYEALKAVDVEIERVATDPPFDSTVIYDLGTLRATVVLHQHNTEYRTEG